MDRRTTHSSSLTDECGEVASWLIVMAALAAIAATLGGIVGPIMTDLAQGIDGRGTASASAPPAQDTAPPDASAGFPNTPAGQAGSSDNREAQEPRGNTTVPQPENPAPLPRPAPGPEHPAPAPRPVPGLENPALVPVPVPDPDPAPVEPEPLTPETQAALDRIIHAIDNDDDLGMSEGELDDVRDELKALSPEQREQVIAALTPIQLERLFHNVHGSGFWSNDWNDKERNEFYGLLSILSRDAQQRLSAFTDYFDLYDSDLDPRQVPITEDEFVEGYEAITNLPIDEFLALRAFMWDNPDLIADSPFDWYADGCSIPGGKYPGALNGPCLLHDFAYTNAKIAADRFDDAYTDVEGSDIAERWKQHADRRLADDIGDLPWWQVGDSEAWAGVVYTGVAVDFDVVGLASGRAAFVDEYVLHYGPGFDPNLGQWPDDWNDSYTMDYLVDLATNGAR